LSFPSGTSFPPRTSRGCSNVPHKCEISGFVRKELLFYLFLPPPSVLEDRPSFLKKMPPSVVEFVKIDLLASVLPFFTTPFRPLPSPLFDVFAPPIISIGIPPRCPPPRMGFFHAYFFPRFLRTFLSSPFFPRTFPHPPRGHGR